MTDDNQAMRKARVRATCFRPVRREITMSKKTKKPFATKPPKGTVHVHLVIGVAVSGDVEVVHALPHQSMDSVIAEATPYLGGPTDHHVCVLRLPIPKMTKAKKIKAKKVTKAADSKKKAVKKTSKKKASKVTRPKRVLGRIEEPIRPAKAKRVRHDDAAAAIQPAELNSDGTMPDEMPADPSAN
jgi:hypothetical protein